MSNTTVTVGRRCVQTDAEAIISPLEIVERRIGEEHRAVSARALHRGLGIRRDFTNWIKAQIKRAKLVEGEDFALLAFSGEQTGRGGHNRVDYLLTLEAAKHVALMSGTPKGRAYRAYLIRCERELVGIGTSAAQQLARLMFQLDRLNAAGSDAGRALGSLRRRREVIETAAAPLRAVVEPMLDFGGAE